ncbi:MAG: LysR family transcriptional regulator [Pseudomonadota bacterium]
MPFDLRLLESFVAVAETRSFSKAAQRTNTVQSAVSMHIKLLEQHVNQALVLRGRGMPVSLTNEGAAFLVQARRLLLLADEIIHGAGEFPKAAPIRLGTTITFALSVVPKALRMFAAQSGADPVTVKTARSHDLMALLETGQIDLALVFDQGTHPMRQKVIETPLAWVATESFAWSRSKTLRVAFLDDARDLRRHAFSALDAAAAGKTSLTTCPDPIGLRSLLLAGLAVSVLPEAAITPELSDVGPRLGLPVLDAKQVCIYSRTDSSEAKIERLAHALISVI